MYQPPESYQAPTGPLAPIPPAKPARHRRKHFPLLPLFILFSVVIAGALTGRTAAHLLIPSPSPPAQVSALTPTPPPCPYPPAQENRWCFTFTDTGKVIYGPPDDFCLVFPCISSFWQGNGYIVQCADDLYSLSGGNPGVCSRHGGYLRTLYAP